MALERILSLLHHLHDEGLSGGVVERVDHSLKEAQRENLANGDASAEREIRERERLEHRQELSAEQDPMAAEPIDEGAADGGEEKRRDLIDEPEHPQ